MTEPLIHVMHPYTLTKMLTLRRYRINQNFSTDRVLPKESSKVYIDQIYSAE